MTLYEVRTYTLRVGTIMEAVKLYQETRGEEFAII